ncbi:MAG: peptidylprolyl isomerase, partial [Hypericibacter sp.]
MNKLLMAGVAAVLVFATQPLLADDATTTTPAAAPAAPAADADPVVAIVNGTPLHRSDVVASARGLPEQYQQ